MKFYIGQDVLPHECKGIVYNHDSSERLRILHILFRFVFAVFIVRTLSLSLQHTEMSNGNLNLRELESRADIIDRNGVVLAKSVKFERVKLYPSNVNKSYIDDIANVIHKIAPVDYNVSDALRIINSGKTGVYIKNNPSKHDIELINDANRKYKCSKLNCFELESSTVRHYPQRNVFSHVVGFVGKDQNGLEGVEATYNKYLKENKDPLRLSIDSRIQNIFYKQLSLSKEKFRAKSALGMLMNSTTGEIIAMVQVPDFDPNNVNSAPKEVRRQKLLRDTFLMGSIFKIFNTVLAYENNLQDKYYEVDKPFMIPDKFGRPAMKKPIDDVSSLKKYIKRNKITKLKAWDIMLHSCNVGTAKIALDLPQGIQQEFFQRLHFDKPLNLEFGKTESTIMHKRWGPVERATAGFGQGIQVTPMHLLLAVNAVTNGGIYIYPTLLKRSIGAVRGEHIIDPEISATIRQIMFQIAEQTTGKNARVKGIDIGGKTGTAEKHVNGKVDKNTNVAVFTGIFPISAPQYVILVLLDEPQKTKETGNWHTASLNAVPTAGAILNEIMPLLF